MNKLDQLCQLDFLSWQFNIDVADINYEVFSLKETDYTFEYCQSTNESYWYRVNPSPFPDTYISFQEVFNNIGSELQKKLIYHIDLFS